LGFFSNKSDHPLASLKSAQQLLEGLPKTDPVVVLDEIGHWIEALFEEEQAFRLDHQFAVMRMLDDVAHPYLRRINYSYFAVVQPGSFQENRLWSAMNSYFIASEAGYLHLIRGIENREKGSAAIKPDVPLISTRGIYALFGRLECAGVRYAQLDPQLWVHLAEFYACAEQEQCQEEQLSIYASMGVISSVEHLFASVLMWYSVGEGALQPLDLHIAKLLMIYMCKSFSVSAQPRADSLFAFDLGNPALPVRVTDDDAMYPPGMRFVSIGSSTGQLENLLKTLGKGLVPEELNLGVPYSADVVAEVVRRLSTYCKLPLPVRRHQRRKIQMKVNVANGFLNVVAQGDAGMSFMNSTSEAWDVEDMSATGLSCLLPSGRENSVKIGGLVGLQAENSGQWGAGIVRRMRRDAQNNLHVGVRVLSNKVVSIVLNDPEIGHVDANHLALLVQRAEEKGDESLILMKSDTFSINRSPTMTLDNQNYLLMPMALIEKGPDFDLVRYRKMKQESGSDEAY